MLNKNHLLNWCCCDRKSRAAYAQSFAPWQQATIEITRRDHSIIACSRHTHIFLFFAHIPVVVNHTINATPPEGCNNIPSFLKRTTPIARSLCEGWTPHDLHILVTAPLCCDRKSRAAYAQSFTLWQQATIEFTCHDHSIIACSRHMYGVVLHAHPVRGESHNQHNTTREVAAVSAHKQIN